MQLLQKVRQFFEMNGEAYGLVHSRIDVKPILNWGGFVNSSFCVSDGHRLFHLKLSSDVSTGLELFYMASKILHERYHSPKAHCWIKIPDTEFGGILFDSIQGNAPDVFSGNQIKELGQMLSRMQQDTELRSLLGNKQIACLQTYLDVYEVRFFEDLNLIKDNLPPFVSRATFDFMKDEAEKLSDTVMKRPEFRILTDMPIHSDIWTNNLIVSSGNAWFLIGPCPWFS